jgi:CDP-diacylglycerol--glycerol-3-phosphate 3-phosphatidyltransferase
LDYTDVNTQWLEKIMIWNIPNILTTFRMLAAPAVVLVFLFLARPYADWVALILFVGAAITDYFDGYLARKWNQQSAFGTMLDPIADKAMVILAFLAIVGLYGLTFAIAAPATIILLREVFVSGLREFLGENASKLAVTKIAKWKTTVQMVAISVLFAQGIFAHNTGMRAMGMDSDLVAQILAGTEDDLVGLRLNYYGSLWSYWAGITLLWLAAILTFVTGMDYLNKAMPYLKGEAK